MFSLRIIPSWNRIKHFCMVWKVPIVVGILMLAAWQVRGPVLKVTGKWRAAWAVESAEELAEKGQWKAAEKEARRALQLDRGRIDGMRVLLDASVRNRNADSLRLAAAVFSHPESSIDDKAKCLELLLLSQDFIGFRRLQSMLNFEQLRVPDIVLQTTRFLSLRGEHSLALQRLEQFRESGGGVGDDRFRLLEADLHLRAGNPAAAQAVIGSMLEGRSEHEAAAFRMLDRVPIQSLDPALLPILDSWLAAAESQAEATTSGDGSASVQATLVKTTLEIREATLQDDGPRVEDIIATTLAEWGDSHPAELGQWLFRLGEGKRVADLIDEETGRTSAVLYDLRLRSLLQAGDFAAADAWLEKAGSESDRPRIEALHAMISRRLEKESAAMTHWRSAMHEAAIRDEGNLYLRLGAIALEFGEGDWAVEAILEASQYPETLLPPATDLTSLLDYLLKQDRVGEAVELSRYWLAREPENPSLRNNYLYLKLLSGEPVESSLMQTQALSKSFPGMLGYQTTHALFLALLADPAEARQVIERESLDWSRATPSDLAIRRFVLERSGDAPETPAPGNGGVSGIVLYPAEARLFENGLPPQPATPPSTDAGSSPEETAEAPPLAVESPIGEESPGVEK